VGYKIVQRGGKIWKGTLKTGALGGKFAKRGGGDRHKEIQCWPGVEGKVVWCAGDHKKQKKKIIFTQGVQST